MITGYLGNNNSEDLLSDVGYLCEHPEHAYHFNKNKGSGDIISECATLAAFIGEDQLVPETEFRDFMREILEGFYGPGGCFADRPQFLEGDYVDVVEATTEIWDDMLSLFILGRFHDRHGTVINIPLENNEIKVLFYWRNRVLVNLTGNDNIVRLRDFEA